MDEDAKMFGIRNWWMVPRNRDEWTGFFEEAKIQRIEVPMMMMMMEIITDSYTHYCV